MRKAKAPLIRSATFFQEFAPAVKQYVHKAAGYLPKYQKPPKPALKIPYVPTPLDIELVQQGIEKMKIYIDTLTPADFLGPNVNEAQPAKLPNGSVTGGPVEMEFVVGRVLDNIENEILLFDNIDNQMLSIESPPTLTHKADSDLLVIKIPKNLGNEIPGSGGRRTAGIPNLSAKMVDAVLRHHFSPRSKDKK